MNIVLATRNKKKIEEMKKILSEIISQTDINIFTPDDFQQCMEVEEDGNTFEENAVKKARYISTCTGLTAIADDSGLEVDALNNAPGIFSARYAGPDADDTANCKKLLHAMEAVPDNKRGARFVCCIAVATGDSIKTFLGYAEGKIGTALQGKKGFGYDPLFYPEGHNRTFAEMSDDEKNALSHRGKALKELQKYLKETGILLKRD